MTLINRYPPLLAPSLDPQVDLARADLDKEREERVLDPVRDKGLSLTREHLSERMDLLHGDNEVAMCDVLERVDKLYKENFPRCPDTVNATYDSYTFLDPEKNEEKIQEMFKKAETLYIAYREQCVNEALPGLPIYIHKKLNLEQEDLPIVKKFIERVRVPHVLKEHALYHEFGLFHRPCALRVIHYYLRIPRYIPNSKTGSVVYHLPFKKS